MNSDSLTKDKQRAVALLKAMLSTQPNRQVYVTPIDVNKLSRKR